MEEEKEKKNKYGYKPQVRHKSKKALREWIQLQNKEKAEI